MSTLLSVLVLTLLLLAAPFPLPLLDGKPLAVTEGQRTFRVPLRFERLRAFYEQQLAGNPDVTRTLSGRPGARVLTLVNRNKADAWRRATVREGELETRVEVVPVLRMDATEISGHARPLVQFVIGRSAEVDRALQGIDHTEQVRQ